jgi:hypothetical protein
VSPVKYELEIYAQGDGIRHSHRRKNLKFYTTLTLTHASERLNVT